MKCQDHYPTWKGYLFRLQQEAPKPKPVTCREKLQRPHFYGHEYHGLISRDEGESLCSLEGNFLIRESQTERGRFTLVLRVLNMVKNFKLYYECGKHFVGEKRFDSVYDLAEDGLITMYVESKAQDYIESMTHEPVYDSLSRYSSVGRRRQQQQGTMTERARNETLHPHTSPLPTEKFGDVHQDDSENLFSSQCFSNGQMRDPPPVNLPETYHHQHQHHHHQQQPVGHVIEYVPGFVPSINQVDDIYTRSSSEQENCETLCHGRSCSAELVVEESQAMCGGEMDRVRQESGLKKSLTPTSSDERKRTKKRIATESDVMKERNICNEPDSQFLYQEELYRELAAVTPLDLSHDIVKPHRAISHDHYGCSKKEQEIVKKDVISRRRSSGAAMRSPSHHQSAAYHRAAVAHKQATTVAQVRQLNAGMGQFRDNHNQLNKTACSSSSSSSISSNDKSGSPCLNEVTSLDHLMSVHRKLKEKSQVRGGKQPVESINFHSRQRSEPVETLYGHSYSDEQESGLCENNAKRLYRHNSLLNKVEEMKRPNNIEIAESEESCESSNSSNYTERIRGNYLHDSSNVSSEDDRFTPSPLHITDMMWQRRVVESPRRQKSDNIQDERSRNPESPWKERRDTEQQDPSRDDSLYGNVKKSPFSLFNSNDTETVYDVDVTTSHEKMESVEVGPRRKSIENMTTCPYSSRHKSESGCAGSDETSKVDVEISKVNLEESLQRSSDSNENKSKPLERRATTSDVTTKGKSGHALMPRKGGSVKERQGKQKFDEDRPQHKSSPAASVKSKKSGIVSSPSNRHRALPPHRNITSSSSPSKSGRVKCLSVHHYDKEHHYKSHTYRGLQWCEYCGNFMWGIIQQGVQCVDCGLNVHKQCAKLVPNDCQPALKHVKHVFGVDLTTIVKLHGTQRPIVIDLCIAEIEKRGMDSEGIYRVPGYHDNIVEVKADFDEHGIEAKLSSSADVDSVAGALKLYLRELPVPLVPYQLYSRFINAAKISHSDGKLDAIRMALSAMPGAHLQTIKFLILHLGRVRQLSHINQMTADNLGIVFGPTLLRAPEKESQAQYYKMNDTTCHQEVIATMIEYRHYLFGPG